jgi:C-terminal processing protease CtpA/Prc
MCVVAQHFHEMNNAMACRLRIAFRSAARDGSLLLFVRKEHDMRRRIVGISPLLATVLLVGLANPAIADDPQQSPDQAQATSDQQQPSQQATNQTNQQNDQQPADTEQRNNSQQSAQSNTQSNDSATPPNNNSTESTSGPVLPPPGNSQNNDANRPQDRSVLKDSRESGQTQADRRDADAPSDRANDRFDRGQYRTDRRDARDDRRDVRGGISIGRATDRGLTIDRVERNGIFYRSGLRDSDVIISINGRPVRSEADFERMFVFERGRRVPFAVFRDGRQQTIYVTQEDENVAYESAPIKTRFGVVFDSQVNDAAIVARVGPGSPAERAGLRPSDVIIGFNGARISSPDQAIDIIAGIPAGQRLDIEYSRITRTSVNLQSGREHDVARLPVNANVDVTSIDANAPETRRDDGNRDENARDRQRSNRPRGILPWRRN